MSNENESKELIKSRQQIGMGEPGKGRRKPLAEPQPEKSPRQGKAKRKSPRPAATPSDQTAPDGPVEMTMPNLDPPDFVVIAQISSPFGLRGAVKANIQTDFPQRFEQLGKVLLSPPGNAATVQREERSLMSARVQNDKHVVLRFEGITKVEQAELLRGYDVSIPIAEVVDLPEGEYYIFQIIGLEVYSTEEQYLGIVVNVERLPANDIYLVRGPLSPKDLLIPAIKDVVKEIDLEAKRMTIELLEGLI